MCAVVEIGCPDEKICPECGGKMNRQAEDVDFGFVDTIFYHGNYGCEKCGYVEDYKPDSRDLPF